MNHWKPSMGSAKKVELVGIFKAAAERGNDLGITVYSPSGEVIEEFEGSPAAAQAFVQAHERQKQDKALGKSMGGGVPYLDYVLEEPSTIDVSNLGTTTHSAFRTGIRIARPTRCTSM